MRRARGADNGGLKVLDDVCGRGRVGVGWRVRKWSNVRGRARQPEVGFVGMGTWIDKAGDAGDAVTPHLLCNGGVALILDNECGGDGVAVV